MDADAFRRVLLGRRALIGEQLVGARGSAVRAVQAGEEEGEHGQGRGHQPAAAHASLRRGLHTPTIVAGGRLGHSRKTSSVGQTFRGGQK